MFNSLTAIVKDRANRSFLVNNGLITHFVEQDQYEVKGFRELLVPQELTEDHFGVSRYSTIGRKIEDYLKGAAQ
jgi:hypothetical protein